MRKNHPPQKLKILQGIKIGNKKSDDYLYHIISLFRYLKYNIPIITRAIAKISIYKLSRTFFIKTIGEKIKIRYLNIIIKIPAINRIFQLLISILSFVFRRGNVSFLKPISSKRNLLYIKKVCGEYL